MSDDSTPDEGAGNRPGVRPWDAAQVLRRRAEMARAERDESIAQLRRSMTDDDVLTEFGIDLGEIEK